MNERLRELRRALRLSQKDFAAKLGVQQPQLSAWEHGSIPVSRSRVMHICQAFGVNRQWLETGKEPMFLPEARGLGGPALFFAGFGELFRTFSKETQKACVSFLQRLYENGGDLRDALDKLPQGLNSARTGECDTFLLDPEANFVEERKVVTLNGRNARIIRVMRRDDQAAPSDSVSPSSLDSVAAPANDANNEQISK